MTPIYSTIFLLLCVINTHIMKIWFALLSLFFCLSCDDGGIAIESFDFDQSSLNYCDAPQGYLFYALNDAETEAIMAQVLIDPATLLVDGTANLVLNGNTQSVVYRVFDQSVTQEYFCSAIPPNTPQVIEEFTANSGDVELISVVSYDDFDGLSLSQEGDLNLDTDVDGLPNFYDFDDDGDNVPTLFELDLVNADGDNDPLTNPLDTDSDGLPDYLDPDDDGDGVLTINEDNNYDLDPTNDVSDLDFGADYLNPEVAVDYSIELYREHVYEITSALTVILRDLVLVRDAEEIIKDVLVLGVLPRFLTEDVVVTPLRD